MKTYTLPGTELKISRIAYGCGSLGGSWDQTPLTQSARENAAKALRAALDGGINFFDHADIYCYGKSEQVFGECFSELGVKRGQIIIQTKCGIRFKGDPTPDAPGRYDFSSRHMAAAVEGSLKRLRTDYIDILLLHRPDALV